MAERYGFFDAVVTNNVADRIYSADDFNNLFNGILSDGVFRLYENALRVSAGSGLSVNVDTGKAIVKDHWYINTTIKNMLVKNAHATLHRYSSVVLRFNKTLRSVNMDVIDGIPSSTPVVPNLTCNNDIYEIRLANIYVGAGVTSLTDDVLTDTREYTGGIVDTPKVDYRRHTYKIVNYDTQRYFDIPTKYNFTPDTFLEVYVAGVLSSPNDYTIQINEVEGNYMVVFESAKSKNTTLEFIMIN